MLSNKLQLGWYCNDLKISVCWPSLATLYRKIPSYKEVNLGCDVISVILKWGPSLLHHLTSTKQYSQSQVFFHHASAYCQKWRRLGSYILKCFFFHADWGEPQTSETALCMLGWLLVAIYHKFVMSTRKYFMKIECPCVLFVSSIGEGLLPECSISVKETREWR